MQVWHRKRASPIEHRRRSLEDGWGRRRYVADTVIVTAAKRLSFRGTRGARRHRSAPRVVPLFTEISYLSLKRRYARVGEALGFTGLGSGSGGCLYLYMCT